MNRFNRTPITHKAAHVHLLMQKKKNLFSFLQKFIFLWDKLPGMGWLYSQTKSNCALHQEYQRETTIRTCNFKALGFQRLSFTASFRSPGSYVSRQLIKGLFSSSPPNSTPQICSHHHSTAIIRNPLIWSLDFYTTQDILRRGKKCCHPPLLFDLVSPEGWLEAIWDFSLKNTLPVFSHPKQLIHLGELALRSLWFNF